MSEPTADKYTKFVLAQFDSMPGHGIEKVKIFLFRIELARRQRFIEPDWDVITRELRKHVHSDGQLLELKNQAAKDCNRYLHTYPYLNAGMFN